MSHTTNLTKRLETIRDWYHYESQPWGDLNDALDTIDLYKDVIKNFSAMVEEKDLLIKELRSRIDTLQQLLKEAQRG